MSLAYISRNNSLREGENKCLPQQPRRTAESSWLSHMPNQQIHQRIWEEYPLLSSFTETSRIFPPSSARKNHICGIFYAEYTRFGQKFPFLREFFCTFERDRVFFLDARWTPWRWSQRSTAATCEKPPRSSVPAGGKEAPGITYAAF